MFCILVKNKQSMGRLIAIDHGEKRCGIAETDDLKMIASPLTTVNTAEIWTFLQNYLSKHTVDGIVIGEAFYLNGQPSATTMNQAKFVQELQKKFPVVPVHRVNEMFTSSMATKAILESGASKKKRADKGLVDAVSAALILQQFLG
jgi:putative Holliday junction resolvase